MRRFAHLFSELDETNRTNEKVAVLERYFAEAPAADAAWALFFLTGQKLGRAVNSRLMREWAAEAAWCPQWLFEECYGAVGDFSETIALLFHESATGTDEPLHRIVEERLIPLKHQDDVTRRRVLEEAWRTFSPRERFLWNKLMFGNFRVGVSRTLVVRALAKVAGVEQAVMAHRLMGVWEPKAEDFQRILQAESDHEDITRPYPFFLASPLEEGPATLGAREEWQIEWKWDGIRAQMIHRAGQVLIWSRGEELITDRFPEVEQTGRMLPEGTVLDGEILAWSEGRPLPFAVLQKRIGRKKLSAKILREAPAAFVAYDVLEFEGEDLRERPLAERRKLLERIVEENGGGALHVSPLEEEQDWEALAALRETSRERGVEGFMLKRRSSPYRAGRVRGDWWKWKIDPLTMDAVMIYAQQGTGKRASLHTDYTFGVWRGDELVPVAKAYSGLTDKEIRKVDRWVRQNSLEKHGPVRIVKPELVFEIAFEAIQKSSRHKSGIAVRFPRILRQRTDKKPEEADTIETLEALIQEAPKVSTEPVNEQQDLFGEL